MSTICDDLRAAILQAAMQGKLTQRLSDDDNAEGNIVKHADVKFLANDDYPEEWRFVALGDIAEMGMGKTILKADMKTGGIPVYSATISDKHLGYIDNPTLILKKGDIVIPARGNSIGWATLVKEDRATCTQTTIYCMNIKEFIRPKFLWMCCYAFKDTWFKYEGSAIPQITVSTIKKHLVPIPSLNEQDRIIEKVDELMARVADLEQSADALASLKKAFPDDIKASLLQAAMQGKLTKQLPEDVNAEDLLEEIKAEKEKLIAEGKIKKQKPLAPITDDEIPFNIPENWRWVRLGEIGATNIGLTYSPKNISKNGGTIVLRSSNIQNGKMDYNDIVTVNMEVPQNKMCERGDILICARNGSKRLVGKAAIVDKDGMSFGAFMAIFKSRCNEYILYAINSSVFRERVLGGASTTTINQITQDALSNAIIPLPPLAEQKRIVERLNALMQNINVVGDLIASE